MKEGQKIYFVSDLHLGAPDKVKSLEREKYFVDWLESIKPEVGELFLVGDIFDFWFEYKHAVPKGYIRILGKLAEFNDLGIKVHLFAGNHDLWLGSYLSEQLGATIHDRPTIFSFFNKQFYVAHGDGLGKGDYGYKFLKKLLTSSITKFFIKFLHPDVGIGMANRLSGISRKQNDKHRPKHTHLTPPVSHESERLNIFARDVSKEKPEIDYFIFGHRHILYENELNGSESKVFILGDWVTYYSYLEVDEKGASLKYFPIEDFVS